METDSSMTSLEDSSDNERCEDQGTNKTSENFISDVECKCSEKLEDKQSDALDLLNDRAGMSNDHDWVVQEECKETIAHHSYVDPIAKRHRRNSSSEDENVDTAHDQPRRTRRAQSNDGFSADPAWSDFSVGAHWYPAVFNFEVSYCR